MTEAAIEIQDLHFAYGRKKVLKGVNLSVPKGAIFGFLGPNGSGKTTTIKTMLGLQRPQKGRCTICGLDSFTDDLEVRRRIGFMAEDQQMYGWMTVEQMIRWVAGFYKNWDGPFADELTKRLKLPQGQKVGALSKGQNSSLALLLALGHRPEVVILDDPTLGLDPLARKDFLRHVIDLLQDNKVTVFFSSHLLYEIEPVADHIAILHDGVILRSGKTEEIREQVRKFVLSPKAEAHFASLSGVLDVFRDREHILLTMEGCDQDQKEKLNRMGLSVLDEAALNLDEIFEAYIIGNRGCIVS
jgi:ABC-2 type transport system ATP-binding protein